ncbi:adenylate/guanylate cyclase domain-containing protein [Oscillatoria acuminata]|uniref:Adenylate cyclase n=1 Tax=Oscillatoria acuminata PCC 6304 TaxID=56110 RepID=K9TKW4_9CYAN|nr:adenylate/guanylate cyclase domain-containing protein [Oscillatoria acuminata]AFY83502.1 family 3 adenylate cyclase [Oscillatoria acuminata PCC 6304]
MPKKPKIPWSRYLPAAIIFGMGVGLSVIGFAVVWEWENRRRDYELNRNIDGLTGRLQQQLDADLEVIRTITDFFQASQIVDLNSFEQFVQRPLSNPSTVSLVAWVERVEDADRQDYEERMAMEGDKNFTITQSITPGRFLQRDRLAEYFPISYISPLQDHRNTPGFDLAANPSYQATLKRAAQMGKMVVSERLEWQLGSRSRLGFLAVHPVYENAVSTRITLENDPPPSSLEAVPPLRGFVVGWVEVDNLFPLAGARGNQFNLYLCDETPGTGTPENSRQPYPLLTLVESTELVTSNSATEAFALDVPSECPLKPLENQRDRVRAVMIANGNERAIRREIKVNGRIWAFYIWPTDEYQASRRHWRSWAVLIIGFLWTHIPVTYLLTSVSRTAEIEALALARAEQSDQLQQAFKQLEVEQAKSERLLLNVLPKAIAERLKEETQTIAESFPEVTVLFADLVGFTKLAARISPTELVQLLNEIFTIFDRLAEKHGLEKIKTIGDAYMVVGGLPVQRRNHASAIAEMALEMQTEILNFNRKCHESFAMRMGIHSGPAIAGVIGTHKFIYDLWGDTVNIASRMESHGIPGRIQVSSTTYALLQSSYCFECRGPIPIKGKGEMLVYLLTGRKQDGICQPLFDQPFQAEV